MGNFSKHSATTSNYGLLHGRRYDSELLPILPQEMIFEILVRLPVKSLLKMRSVSKSWLSLISSPQFIKTHLKFSAKNPNFPHHRLLFINSDVKLGTFYTCSLAATMFKEFPCIPIKLDFGCQGPFLESCRVLGSCDGLFCISRDFKDLFLWNPAIGKLKKLPYSGNDVRKRANFGAYGFVYTECWDDYMIVEILESDSTRFQNVVSVYSLRTNSWKRIREYLNVVFVTQVGVFVNGRLHWIAIRGNAPSQCFVSLFNFVDETFRDLALPDRIDSVTDGSLGSLGGNLCVFCHCAVKTDVWVMKEYGLVGSWTKVVSIPLKEMVWPIFMSPKDENLLLLRNTSNLLWYNSGDNTFRRPDENKICCDFWTMFNLYIESLVSPNFLEEV